MIHCEVSYSHPHRHFISFESTFPHSGQGVIRLQLPSWRPGRYELGLFARNIRAWKARDSNGHLLPFRKVSRDCWEVEAEGCEFVRISYEYYAADLNAGSSYLDEEQLYINPVNCFFYCPEQMNLPYTVHFKLPEAYEIACGLAQKGPHTLLAINFDELADSPLIASAGLRHLHYQVGNVRFRIWIQGEHRLNEEKLLDQFALFSRAQIALFGSFPVEEYHFLFQFTPYFLRHGVEHRNSTVIAMGPVADFLNEAWYNRLLGISSHELFHTWNVKAIRPAEMQPYLFDRENYSRLGYVTEGVTTYYGDLVLWQCGIYSESQFMDVLAGHLQDYFDNAGRLNLSVAESSFDTWLDGYVQGVPGRKVSIYNEGALVAWICDMRIRKATSNAYSLDDVMKEMNERFGKTAYGYSEEDYRSILEALSGVSFDDVFVHIINGSADYSPFIQEAMDYFGLQWTCEPASKWSESNLGFSLDEGRSPVSVIQVVCGSPADHSGLWIDDEIITVNGVAPYKNVQQLLRTYSGRELRLRVNRKFREVEVVISEDGNVWRQKHSVTKQSVLTASQAESFAAWNQSPLNRAASLSAI